jgi:hypothetical protein
VAVLEAAFRARARSIPGHVYAPHLNSRWVADVMVNTQRPSEHEGKLWSFALVVQDIFSRFAWAELDRLAHARGRGPPKDL